MHAMIHCQFLTHVSRLFLKEVINQQPEETSKLLCSYHTKTAVFWAVQKTLYLNGVHKIFWSVSWFALNFSSNGCKRGSVHTFFFIPKTTFSGKGLWCIAAQFVHTVA